MKIYFYKVNNYKSNKKMINNKIQQNKMQFNNLMKKMININNQIFQNNNNKIRIFYKKQIPLMRQVK